MSWISNSIDYMNTHQNGSRNWGNHGVYIDHNKVYFSYFNTDIVIADNDAKTLTVNDAGYSNGSTPRAIHQILREFERKDYDVINNCESHYDMWYNTKKYMITIFNYDVLNDSYEPEIKYPIYRTLETIPDDVTPREFRDSYFKRYGYSLIYKQPKHIWLKDTFFSGICYKYTDKHHIGTLMFEPVYLRLIRRTYLKRV